MSAAPLPPPPQAPGALPLVGHLWQMTRDPTGFLASLPRHGDLVTIRLGTQRVHVACSPRAVSQVLRKNDPAFDKGGPFFDNIAAFFGDGLATCPHAKHSRLRRLLQPAFTREAIRGYEEAVRGETAAATARWQEGQVLDVLRAMQELALRFTVVTMFADWSPRTSGSASDLTATLDDVDVLVGGAFTRMVAPGLSRLPLPANRRFEAARRALYTRIGATVAAYRADGVDRGDLLSALLRDAGQGADRLTDTEIREQVMTMFIAGIGTTAAMLAWVLDRLASEPGLDSAIARELRNPSGPAGAPSAALERVMVETLRFRPAAWIFSRVTTATTDLAGHRVTAGAGILVSPFAIHHDPKNFPAPEVFDPDRWVGAESPLSAPFRGTRLLPFGEGARKCIAYEFALTNITLALTGILRRWRLAPAGRGPAGIAARSIIEPKGLRLRLVRRDAGAGEGRQVREQ